jgi:hypothetical protein
MHGTELVIGATAFSTGGRKKKKQPVQDLSDESQVVVTLVTSKDA